MVLGRRIRTLVFEVEEVAALLMHFRNGWGELFRERVRATHAGDLSVVGAEQRGPCPAESQRACVRVCVCECACVV